MNAQLINSICQDLYGHDHSKADIENVQKILEKHFPEQPKRDVNEIARRAAQVFEYKSGIMVPFSVLRPFIEAAMEPIVNDYERVSKERDRTQADCAVMREKLTLIFEWARGNAPFQQCKIERNTLLQDWCEMALKNSSGTALLERLKKAEEDTKRLDWLENEDSIQLQSRNLFYDSSLETSSPIQPVRSAIDSAIAAQSKGGEGV